MVLDRDEVRMPFELDDLHEVQARVYAGADYTILLHYFPVFIIMIIFYLYLLLGMHSETNIYGIYCIHSYGLGPLI